MDMARHPADQLDCSVCAVEPVPAYTSARPFFLLSRYGFISANAGRINLAALAVIRSNYNQKPGVTFTPVRL
jgi:hypothetical protein